MDFPAHLRDHAIDLLTRYRKQADGRFQRHSETLEAYERGEITQIEPRGSLPVVGRQFEALMDRDACDALLAALGACEGRDARAAQAVMGMIEPRRMAS